MPLHTGDTSPGWSAISSKIAVWYHCWFQRFLQESGRHKIAFLNGADPTFGRLHQVLDVRMKELTSEGVGTIAKRAQVISKDKEELLWSTGVFDINSAQGLTYLVFSTTASFLAERRG